MLAKKQEMRGIAKVGYRKGKLVVIGIEPSRWNEKRKQHEGMVKCICDCGNVIITPMANISPTNKKNSCGCLRFWKRPPITHGLSKHPLFSVWSGMIGRCYNKKSKIYPGYGGRGVVVCDQWKSDFKSFYDWALENGWQKGLHLDKDIKARLLGFETLLYSPERCSFVTSKQNQRSTRGNTFLTHNGQTKCISEWVEVLGISRNTINRRIKLGMPIEAILSRDRQYIDVYFSKEHINKNAVLFHGRNIVSGKRTNPRKISRNKSELSYIANRFRITILQVREVIKEVGNARNNVYRYIKRNLVSSLP